MTDLTRAVSLLAGHSIALVRGETVITHDGRGISPMMELIAAGTELTGFSAADLIVGKAAALLFLKAGIAAIHAKTISAEGLRVLRVHGIPCTYEVLTERIINRQGTGLCPMETTVLAIDDPDAAYPALLAAWNNLRGR